LTKFHYLKNRKIRGPFTFDELKYEFITRNTLIWYPGLKNWVKAKNVIGLNDIIISSAFKLTIYKRELTSNIVVNDALVDFVFNLHACLFFYVKGSGLFWGYSRVKHIAFSNNMDNVSIYFFGFFQQVVKNYNFKLIDYKVQKINFQFNSVNLKNMGVSLVKYALPVLNFKVEPNMPTYKINISPPPLENLQ
jgi:hypothetical protein